MTRREWMRAGAMAAAVAATGAQRGFAQRKSGSDGKREGGDELKVHAEAKGLAVGAAISAEQLRTSEAYRRVVASEFDMVVGENSMKWGALRPAPEGYDFKQADQLVAFAEQHGIKVRGHNLCWHEYLPKWFAGVATKENAAKLLTDHIRTVVGRYKGRIHSWDVVNEAIWVKDGRPDGMRSSSPWFELLGEGYVEMAFRAARQADPGALLTYNDYGLEYDMPEEMKKRAAILSLVRRLHEAKPEGGRRLIDAVGVQSHLKTSNLDKLGDGIREFARTMQTMGVQVMLTELDVDDDEMTDKDTSEADKDVAAVYRQYLGQMLQEKNVTAVLVWGVADSQSWLQGAKWRVKHPGRKERPLPFVIDDAGKYERKPAYFAIRDAIEAAKGR